MTIAELEKKVEQLELEVKALRNAARKSPVDTRLLEGLGLFADDPEFAEVIRLGREYRDQENARDRP